MKTEGLSFPEAVEKLAGEAGMPVPRATPQERERPSAQPPCRTSSSRRRAGSRSSSACRSAARALDYLRGRGLRDATIDDFRLGFAPDSRDGLLGALQREGVADRQDWSRPGC